MIIAIVALFGLLLIASLPLIIFSTVKITVTIEHSRAVEELQVDVKALFGLVLYSKAIPLKDLLENGEEAIKEKAEETTFKGEIHDLLTLIKKTHEAKDAVQFILEKTSVRKIQWETNFGLTNAANTAVGAELLLNAKIAFFALLSHYSNLLTVPQLIVTPIYEVKTIQTYIKCMITFKLGHAMIAVIKLLKSQKNIQGT